VRLPVRHGRSVLRCAGPRTTACIGRRFTGLFTGTSASTFTGLSSGLFAAPYARRFVGPRRAGCRTFLRPGARAGGTGIGLSQRAQSFVTDPADGPFNVIEPGKRPRVTLTPTIALRDGEPYLSFAVQGGDSQDQNLLQFFLNVVEWGMTVQQSVEAPNINSSQMRSSFGDHETRPGRMLVASSTPEDVRAALRRMGYALEFAERTSGPINAVFFDRKHRTMWGGSSHHGEDYGIAW
jgi:gamma-glutamyltranspeptidase / glutathione hydrolase